jgi:hypothetical protein
MLTSIARVALLAENKAGLGTAIFPNPGLKTCLPLGYCTGRDFLKRSILAAGCDCD